MADVAPHIKAFLHALKFQGGRTEQLFCLTDSEWNDLFSQWKLERFMIPMRQLHGDLLPAWVRERIDLEIAGNSRRFQRIQNEYSAIREEMRRAGAEHVVIKGFAQWPAFVEHPRFRRQSDIDLYSAPEFIVRAREALVELGYEPAKGPHLGPSDHLTPMVRRSNWKWRGDFFDPEMPIGVDLHFRLWDEETSFLRLDLSPFWSRRRDWNLDQFRFTSFDLVDGVGYFALVIVRDLMRGGFPTANLYEMARFLEANENNDQFWQDWRDTHDRRLQLPEAIAYRLASRLFAAPLAEPVQSVCAAMPAGVQAWFERYGDAQLLSEFSPNKDFVWLHASLVPDRGQRRALLRARLLPARIPPIDAPYIADDPVGQATASWWQRRVRHLRYVVFRAAQHLGMLFPALWHGICLWLRMRSDHQEAPSLSTVSNKAEFL